MTSSTSASRIVLTTLILVCLVALPLSLRADEVGHAAAAFDQLKALEGTWQGDGMTADEPNVHTFEVSAAGTVVMETMGPGTDHEMINMYHLDGDDLMLTHYCAGGNQPRMRMTDADPAKAIAFEYFDGTNLDPAIDPHIHAGKLVFSDNGSIESHWTSFKDGEKNGKMVFTLSRAAD